MIGLVLTVNRTAGKWGSIALGVGRPSTHALWSVDVGVPRVLLHYRADEPGSEVVPGREVVMIRV